MSPDTAIDRVFGVLASAGTYKRLAFLLFGFPLGVAYFVSMTPLLAAGIGTLPIGLGILVLAAALLLVTLYARLERSLMEALLGAVFTAERKPKAGIRSWLLNAAAWKRVAYFAFRLPLSALGFGIAIGMIAGSCLLFAPLLYAVVPIQVGFEEVTRWDQAIVVSCGAALLTLLAAHGVNAIADLERRLAEWLL